MGTSNPSNRQHESPPAEPLTPSGSDGEKTPAIIENIASLAARSTWIASRVRSLETGEVLLREGQPNDSLFVVLEGGIELLKSGENERSYRVSAHGKGELLGVNSSATGKASFCTARALAPSTCLALSAEDLRALPNSHPSLNELIESLIVANLAGRYRSAVRLQIELQRTNERLQETRDRLVQQEKMAVLGQLVAGVAHELNNPSAALLRQAEFLESTLPAIFQSSFQAFDSLPWHEFWKAGQHTAPAAAQTTSRRMEEILARQPNMPRSLARRWSAIPPQLFQVAEKIRSPENRELLLQIFESAFFLHVQKIAARQIGHIVASLKNYARPGSSEPESVLLRESLENALALCGNLLRQHPLELDLSSNARVLARPGDLQQIWTNLIKNACEAMPDGLPLGIRISEHDTPEQSQVAVEIIDHGPGIPPELRDTVFELNFTTKTGAAQFGLGLGLGISSSLASQMGGTIEIRDTPGGGATLVVILPVHRG